MFNLSVEKISVIISSILSIGSLTISGYVWYNVNKIKMTINIKTAADSHNKDEFNMGGIKRNKLKGSSITFVGKAQDVHDRRKENER